MNAGSWSAVLPWPIVGIHAVLTPDGRVLTFGTDQNGQQGAEYIHDVWDPVTGTHTTINVHHTDFFCSAAIIDPISGNVLIAGGDARPQGSVNAGVPNVNLYDYRTGGLFADPAGFMNYARWYPTSLTLADGKTFIVGGSDGVHVGVGTPELYTSGIGWKALDGAYSASIANGWWYPRAWLSSSGEVAMFISTGDVLEVDPSGNGTVVNVGRTPFQPSDFDPAAMYDQDKVLTIDPSGNAWIMDLSGPTPTFRQTAGLAETRAWSNMTVLADGSVMLSGGSGVDNELVGVANEVAIWHPDTGQWTFGADAATPRLYHSTTLLLPDGRVLSTGGGAPGPAINLNAEIYTPPYLLNDDGTPAVRPVITGAPDRLEQGQTFTITVDNADVITRLEFVKFGSATHSFNSEQRALELDFTRLDSHTLQVTFPANANVVTPGYWMLFANNNNGTPSVAATISIGLGGELYSAELATYLTLNGSAIHDALSGVYTLTPDAAGQVGEVMSNGRIDLTHNFDLSFRLFMGSNDAGADGVSFVLHNDSWGQDAVGSGGAGLGSFGIQSGLAIEFDTWQNADLGDIAADHTGIVTTDPRAKTHRVTDQVALNNLEDGKWHNVEVSWKAQTQSLSYSFDGRLVQTLNKDIVSDYFSGSNSVYFGFTGSTGAASNLQQLQLTSLAATFAPTDTGNAPLDDGCVFDVSTIGNSVTLNGDATYSGFTRTFTLTPDAQFKAGSAMLNTPVDLAHNFNLVFEINLGSHAQGADGIAFVMHNDPAGAAALGANGGNLGAIGLQHGLAIEFDTYANGSFGDIANDHTDFISTAGGGLHLTPQTDLGNIADGAWHQVGVTWDAASQTLRYWVDGRLGGTLAGDIASQYLGGSTSTYIGFTGATGGLANQQHVRVSAVDAQFHGVTDVHNCIQDPVAVSHSAAMVGSASYDASTNTFTLTPDQVGQAGAVMVDQRIDLTDDFAISFDAFLGSNANGADGVTFVLHNDPRGVNALGAGGGNYGAVGLANGLAIAIDTWRNPEAGDLATDHTNFFTTGDKALGASRVSEQFSLGNVKDGAWHNVLVVWNSDTRTMTYWIDGREAGTLNGNISQEYLGGSQYAYLGFTGATGGASNLQQVQIDSLTALWEGEAHNPHLAGDLHV
jgi:lectin family protein/galactose oxidase-like protein